MISVLLIIVIALQCFIAYKLHHGKFAVYGEKTDEVQIIIKHRKPRKCSSCKRELSEVTLVNGKWVCMNQLCRENA